MVSVLTFVSLALASNGSAVPQDSQWLTKIADQLRSEFNLPAVWLASGEQGKVTTAVSGVKRFGEPTLATVNDRLLVASITKPFTGCWIASLVEQGKIGYETKLVEILPSLVQVCPPDLRGVSLGQLLSHSSGIKNDIYRNKPGLSRSQRIEEVTEWIKTVPNLREVGAYQNNGVLSAGVMAEQAIGDDYNMAIINFYQKLGLTSFGLGNPVPNDDLSNCWPHTMMASGPSPKKPSTNLIPGYWPQGSAHCSIGDLAQFGQWFMDGVNGKKSILRNSTYPVISSEVQGSRYTKSCFGRYAWDTPVFWHQGGIQGGSSELSFIPSLNILWAIHTNLDWFGVKGTNHAFLSRAHDLILDALRSRRAKSLGYKADVRLAGVEFLDTSDQLIERPPASGKFKVRLVVDVYSRNSGDIKFTAQLGSKKAEANNFLGIKYGRNRPATFEFDHADGTDLIVTADAANSVGDPNRTNKQIHISL
jgi:CubicO group peptidase (beta-lactamase class C family)